MMTMTLTIQQQRGHVVVHCDPVVAVVFVVVAIAGHDVAVVGGNKSVVVLDNDHLVGPSSSSSLLVSLLVATLVVEKRIAVGVELAVVVVVAGRVSSSLWSTLS